MINNEIITITEYEKMLYNGFSIAFKHLDKETREKYIKGYIDNEKKSGSLERCFNSYLENAKNSNIPIKNYLIGKINQQASSCYMMYPDY